MRGPLLAVLLAVGALSWAARELQLVLGECPQLVVDQRHEPVRRRSVAVSEGKKDLRCLCRRGQ